MTKKKSNKTAPTTQTTLKHVNNTQQNADLDLKIKKIFEQIMAITRFGDHAGALRLLTRNRQLLMTQPTKCLPIEARIRTSQREPEAALKLFSEYEDYMKNAKLELGYSYKTGKASALIQLEQYAEARDLLRTIHYKEMHTRDYAFLIKCLLELNLIDPAKDRLKNLLDDSGDHVSKHPEICRYFAQYYQKNNDKKQAFDWLDKVLRPTSDLIVSEDIIFLESAAEIYAYFKDYKMIDLAVDALIKINPKFKSYELLFRAKYHVYCHPSNIRFAEELIYRYVDKFNEGQWDEKALLCVTQCNEIAEDHERAAAYHTYGLKIMNHCLFIRRNATRHANEHPRFYPDTHVEPRSTRWQAPPMRNTQSEQHASSSNAHTLSFFSGKRQGEEVRPQQHSNFEEVNDAVTSYQAPLLQQHSNFGTEYPATPYGAPSSQQHNFGTGYLTTPYDAPPPQQHSNFGTGYLATPYGAPSSQQHNFGTGYPITPYGAPPSQQHNFGTEYPITPYGAPSSQQHNFGTGYPITPYGAPSSQQHNFGTEYPTTPYGAPPSQQYNFGTGYLTTPYSAPSSQQHNFGTRYPTTPDDAARSKLPRYEVYNQQRLFVTETHVHSTAGQCHHYEQRDSKSFYNPI